MSGRKTEQVRRYGLLGAAVSALPVWACSTVGQSPTGPTADSGTTTDAQARDAARKDAATRDAATKDAATRDTGLADAFTDVGDGSAPSKDARQPEASRPDGSADAGSPAKDGSTRDAGLPALPAAVVAAGCTKNIFFDDFDDLNTVDMQDTRAPGFNWYRYSAAAGTSTPIADFGTVLDGTVTALRFTAAGGGGLNGATRSTQHGAVGFSFNAMGGKCTYIEGRVAMGLAPATASAWPAFWSNPTKHLQNLPMQWAGDPATGYDHYLELDIMELNPRYSDNARATVIDWYGDYLSATTDCNQIHYCKVQDSQGLGPNVAGTYDSSEAAPKFHRYGALWIPSVPRAGQPTYSQGAMHWYIDGVELGTPPTWVGPPSPTSYVPVEPWLYSILDQIDMSLVMNTGGGVFMDVDYAAVWQTP